MGNRRRLIGSIEDPTYRKREGRHLKIFPQFIKDVKLKKKISRRVNENKSTSRQVVELQKMRKI